MTSKPRKLLYVVSEDWYFCSHRLALACAARDQGFEVTVATRVSAHGDVIQKLGLKLYPLHHMKRGSLNPWHDLRALFELWRIYRNVKPDVVHHVAMKPVIYGSIIATLTRVPKVINAFGGMGYLFTSRHGGARILQAIITFVTKRLFNRAQQTLIVQNQDDYDLWTNQLRLPQDKVALIRGSGVDIKQYHPSSKPPSLKPEPEITIVCAARMLWDKGIGDLVEAANLIRAQKVKAKIILCGPLDRENPSAIPEARLAQWQRDGVIEWSGPVKDMAQRYHNAHIAVLPSYREGMPKSLLEAAACGLPIVTTDNS